MNIKTAGIAILALTGLPTLGIAADEPPELSRNPFSRPSSNVTLDLGRVIDRDDRGGISLDLRATMVGSVRKLANIAGRVLKPGDEIDGYRLVAVHEQYAIVERDGRTTTVYVKPLVAEDND